MVGRQYIVNVYNSGIARTSCVAASVLFLENAIANVTVPNQRSCRYDYDVDPDAWIAEPCCNENLYPVDCCESYNAIRERNTFSDGNYSLVEEQCGTPQCAATFFADLAISYNELSDPIRGCASGLSSVFADQRVASETELNKLVRNCAVEVGFGPLFEGIPCFSCC
tara:strand:- start:80 stop:580 length:501 start_codon:yes stop_codon:yes gene_type:complete